MALVWRGPLLWFVVGASVALAGVQAVRMTRQAEAESVRTRAAVQRSVDARAASTSPGVDFAGAALPETDMRVATNPSPLHLRHGCAWGVPGGNPYRGTVEQALAAARLPAKVVREIADMSARGWVYEQVEISRTGIRTLDGRRDFGTQARAMAFGDTLCFNTRVNFPSGHVEYAALYQANDENGQTYSVMVPYVCQNVSVLGAREEIIVTNDVPEPATWSTALLGLGVLALLQWRRGRPNGS